MYKYLIVQLAAYGDCLYATALAKQLKHSQPNCHITWAIARKYSSLLRHNPFVDKLWIVDVSDDDFHFDGLQNVISEANSRKQAKEYNLIIVSQLHRYNWHRFDGTIRGTILSTCPFPMSVDVAPVIRLGADEVNKVHTFVRFHRFSSYKHILLFECSPTSGQSVMTASIAVQIAEILVKDRDDILLILSSPTSVPPCSPHVIDASSLTFRENAELANYCTGLIGCSSGITWLCTSEWVTTKLPTVQLLSSSYMIYAGLEYDHHRWGLDSSHVVELLDPTLDYAVAVIRCFLDSGIDVCREKHHQIWRPNIWHFRSALDQLPVGASYNIACLTYSFMRNNAHISPSRLFFVAVDGAFRKSRLFRMLMLVLYPVKLRLASFWAILVQ